MKDFTIKEKEKIMLKLARENKNVSTICKELGCSRNAYYIALKDANKCPKVSIAILNWLNNKKPKGSE